MADTAEQQHLMSDNESQSSPADVPRAESAVSEQASEAGAPSDIGSTASQRRRNRRRRNRGQNQVAQRQPQQQQQQQQRQQFPPQMPPPQQMQQFQPQQVQQPQQGGKKDPMRLRLDLNLEAELTLKARVVSRERHVGLMV